ncbi:MAG: SRPBCC domain-containing protein [Planctomycetota bacterium]
MRWVWIALAVIAALVLLTAIAGALLPVAHVAARRARFAQPPRALWAAITDLDAMPQWREDLQRIERLSDRGGRPCHREITGFGPIDLCVEVSEPERLRITRIVTGRSPFGGTWTWQLAADGDGTVLTITEHGEVYNVFFRALSRFVFGHTATIDGVLKALGAKFGEAPAIAPAEPAARPAPPPGSGTPGSGTSGR